MGGAVGDTITKDHQLNSTTVSEDFHISTAQAVTLQTSCLSRGLCICSLCKVRNMEKSHSYYSITASAGQKQAEPHYLHEQILSVVLAAPARQIKSALRGLQTA